LELGEGVSVGVGVALGDGVGSGVGVGVAVGFTLITAVSFPTKTLSLAANCSV
jgi:hypothetical protein